MTMVNFWQQDPITLALELSGVIFGLMLISFFLFRFRKHLTFNLHIGKFYVFVRYLLSLLGVVTLFVTLLPGLTPFTARVDPNLGLGGIVLFFLWPLVITQIIIGLVPIERLIKISPCWLWVIIITLYVIALNLDSALIGLVYN